MQVNTQTMAALPQQGNPQQHREWRTWQSDQDVPNRRQVIQHM